MTECNNIKELVDAIEIAIRSLPDGDAALDLAIAQIVAKRDSIY